jgi:GT2 family glycosyltransferase
MDVAVVIVTWNASRWIERTLLSLSISTITPHVYVIDNASSDDTVSLARHTLKECDIIQLGKNLGFGKANNIGIYQALKDGAKFVFLLNQDAHVAPDTIAALKILMEENPKYGIVSPVHLNGSGDAFDHGFNIYIRDTELVSELYLGKTRSLYPIPFVNAAAWMLSRDCLLTVGGFNPIFFMYGEDSELVNRVTHHKLCIGVTPTTQIWHDRIDQSKSNIPTSYQAYFNDRYAYLLTQLARLDIPFTRSVFRTASTIARSISRHALHLNSKLFLREIILGLRLLRILHTVARNRRIAMRSGPHWLNSHEAPVKSNR